MCMREREFVITYACAGGKYAGGELLYLCTTCSIGPKVPEHERIALIMF